MATEMNGVVLISNARLSFPHIAEPQRKVDESTGKERISYNCELIVPKDGPAMAAFIARYVELVTDKWKEHVNTVMQMIQQDRKVRCFGAGEEKVNKKTFLPYDGYAGHAYITCGKDSPPQIIDADGKPIDPSNTMAYQLITRKMYGGCRVNAAIKPWLQENKFGRGIRCDLVALQFAGDDTAFGEGPVDTTGMFGSVVSGPATQPVVQMPFAPFGQTAAPSFAPLGLPSFLT